MIIIFALTLAATAQLTEAAEAMGRSLEQVIPIMEAFGLAVRGAELEEGDE
jgi:hypothetical protein